MTSSGHALLSMTIAAALAAGPFAAPTGARAQQPGVDAQREAGLADGEIRRIDRDGARITIRHGEIRSLDMPPMTMVFEVRDKAIVDQVKIGDRVRFRVVQQGTRLIITEILPAR